MKPKSQTFLQILLLCVAVLVLYWKFFALSLIPADSQLMDSALRYMRSRIAVSWVDFYRWNKMFEAAELEKDTNVRGSIQKLDIAMEYYVSSLNGRETREARENLEAAQREYKKLKEDLRVQERLEEEKKNDESETKQNADSWENSSGSGATGSGSASGNTSNNEENESEDSWKKKDSRTDSSSASEKSGETGSGSTSNTQGENGKKEGPLGYTNTGTFFEGFSGSMSGTGLSTEDEQKLKGALNWLKELQNQKGDYTRPNGISSPTDGMWGLFEKYFGNSSLFWNERDTDPYDY